jgi:hypothetical protein
MITRLENALDQLGPAAVVESSKREFNDEIPFVLDLTITNGYRQFVANFSRPPGLNGPHPDRQLLFYEYQHDSTPAFASPEIIETPQRHLIIGGIALGETRYFRARTINTKFQASRWSKVITSTAARSRIEQTDIADVSTRLVSKIGEWENVFTETYDPFDGAVFLNVHLALGGIQEDLVSNKPSGDPAFTLRGGPAFVQFRFLVDEGSGFREFSQRTILSVRPGYTRIKLGKAPMAFGTFMSEPIRPGNDPITFRLQANKMIGSEWKGGDPRGVDRALLESHPIIFMRNGKIIEVLEA